MEKTGDRQQDEERSAVAKRCAHELAAFPATMTAPEYELWLTRRIRAAIDEVADADDVVTATKKKQQVWFKVFSSSDEADLERQLNDWARSLDSSGGVIRTVKLSIGSPGYAGFMVSVGHIVDGRPFPPSQPQFVLYALANYTVEASS